MVSDTIMLRKWLCCALGFLGLVGCGGVVAESKDQGGDGGRDGQGGDGGGGHDASPLMGMVSLPAGTYRMGCEDGYENQRPEHAVSVDAFEMDVTEVTVDAYQSCVDDGGCTAAAGSEFSQYCNAGAPGRGTHPVNCVVFEQAAAYCASRGKRLPTEEEWEYAARGVDARPYPWGDSEPAEQLCWSGGATGARTATCPVGSHSDGNSPFGAADLAGNVLEWTSSGWSESYALERLDVYRVTRGGHWQSTGPSDVRGDFRGYGYTQSASPRVGFRCVR